MSESKNTEEIILKSAQAVFVRKGMQGARMQEIADEAGINKALLHYYFRSKQKLFEAVFKRVLTGTFHKLNHIFSGELPVEEVIIHFADEYIETLLKNPYIPEFIIHELNQAPDLLQRQVAEILPDINPLLKRIEKEMQEGNIKKFDPKQIIMNTISLCIFPFVGRAIFTQVLYEGNQEQFYQTMEERKKSVSDFILNALKP